MSDKQTHRLVKNPQISARHLADYMAATDIRKRSILVGCKYQTLARVVQHNEAKQIVSKFLRTENPEIGSLSEAAEKLRTRLADSTFDRDLYDHNADYIDRFAKVSHLVSLPEAELLPPGKGQPITLGDVKVTPDLQLRFRRLTKTNKVKIGAATLRYAKGTSLKPEVAEWQSAFLLGYLNLVEADTDAEPERKLCLTIDAYAGVAYPAPTDSVTRFKNMEAACFAIAERWDNIKPPPKAVF